MSIATLAKVDLNVACGRLEVRLASSFKELDAARRLRFEVFNLELREGLLSSYDRGYDTDAYDAWCDHLIVRDMEMDKVVGTYRLLRQEQADRHIGFYSENEFDLTRLREAAREDGAELLELGRSCIAATHRSFATISLLWAAIARYAMQGNNRLLFGCGSLHHSNPTEVAPIYTWLKSRYFAPERYQVAPVAGCRMSLDDVDPTGIDSATIQRSLPPIMRGYLRAGAMVCGEPAYDCEFGTADVLVLLKMEQLSTRYHNHYVVGGEH